MGIFRGTLPFMQRIFMASIPPVASFPGSHSCSGAGESPETRLRVGVAVYCSCKHQDEANFFVDVASASWTGCWPYLLQSSGLSAPRESTRQVG